MSIQLLPIFNWIICSFLSLSFKSCLCILHTNPLSDIWLGNTFSHSVGRLFTLLRVSFVLPTLPRSQDPLGANFVVFFFIFSVGAHLSVQLDVCVHIHPQLHPQEATAVLTSAAISGVTPSRAPWVGSDSALSLCLSLSTMFWGPSVVCVLVVCFFMLLSATPLCECATMCLSTLLWIDLS